MVYEDTFLIYIQTVVDGDFIIMDIQYGEGIDVADNATLQGFPFSARFLSTYGYIRPSALKLG